MIVYDTPNFPNPIRIRIALAEKNATEKVTFVPVDVMGGEHRGAAFLAKNPSGVVPVMELDCGTTISECTAITTYIDESFDGPSLVGSDPKQSAVVHMMQRRAESKVLDAVANYFHHATPGLGPDLETNQLPDFGNAQKAVATSGMQYFDEVLGNSAFVAGVAFSMADITLFAGLAFADFAKVDIPDDAKNLIAWRAKVAARPSVAQL